jgi:nucleotide-binding universal stress UspA family protein
VEKNQVKDRTVKKILVAIDGSDKSDDALDFTLNLCNTIKADIEIFTVITSNTLPGIGIDTVAAGPNAPVIPAYLDQLYEDQRKYSEEILEKAFEKAKLKCPKLKVSKKLASGYPPTEIVEEAKMGFDLVVVAHRGHGFIDELILGSISKQVVDNSPIPVLVVK